MFRTRLCISLSDCINTLFYCFVCKHLIVRMDFDSPDGSSAMQLRYDTLHEKNVIENTC